MAIAESYKKYKKKYGTSQDAVKLFNQPIAEEGALPYQDANGKTVFKLKRWEDLKKNIGRIIPIVDEHPDEKNGKGGLVNQEHKYGFSVIKKCPNANKLLCSDPVLEDGSPVKKGYSIGFAYNPDNTPGTYNNQHYDQIQSDLLIDHIALTDHPRSGHAIMVAGDTNGSNTTINKLIVDYDLFRFTSNKILKKKTQVNNMPHSLDAIKEKLKSDNPEMDEEELSKRADQIKKNEEDQEEEEEKKKKEGDNLLIRMDKDALIAEISRLKGGQDAEKSYQSKIERLEKEKDAIQAGANRYKNELQKVLTNQVHIDIDRLKTVYSFKAKEFDKKSPDFIKGALFASDRIGEGIKVQRSEDIEMDAVSQDGTLDINDRLYNFDTGKMEKVKY